MAKSTTSFICGLFAVAFWFAADTALACDGVWGGGGDFSLFTKETDLVALVKVDKFSNIATYSDRPSIVLSMDVSVLEIYRGHNSSKTIRIWGDSGSLCRPYIAGSFELGKVYIVGLSQAPESKNDYAMSYSWLEVDMETQKTKNPSNPYDVSNLTQIKKSLHSK
ncbi:MAG: hypothetical protein K1X79_04510 [Oligoflexia bacterium]|nr:hypothetical protein [Oligoflexia bacterium]